MFKLSPILNKNILITGSSKGLGHALGKRILTEDGLTKKYTHLIIHGSSKNSLTNGLINLNKIANGKVKISGIVVNFNKAETEQFDEYVIQDNETVLMKSHNTMKDFFKSSNIDEIILNHAVSKDSLIYNIKKEDVDATFNVNIISYINIVSDLLNVWFKQNLRMKADKKIITIGSILNEKDMSIKGNMVYAMTKKNVEMLSKYIKLEYGERFPWLKSEHYNIPFLVDTNLVSNKEILSKMDIEQDTVDNISKFILK